MRATTVSVIVCVAITGTLARPLGFKMSHLEPSLIVGLVSRSAHTTPPPPTQNYPTTWLFSLFGKYLDIKEEVRKILEPMTDDKLSTSVRGALKMVISQQGDSL